MTKFSTIEPNGVPNVPNKLKIINYSTMLNWFSSCIQADFKQRQPK